MEELFTRLRGEELRREADAWRLLHAAGSGTRARRSARERVPARERLGRQMVSLGQRLMDA
jgi:hypothetical protein